MTHKTATLLRPLVALLAGWSTVAVFAVATPPALAAESQGFQISPPVTELSLDPGTGTRTTMKVTNLTDQAMALSVGKQNFAAKGEDGEVDLVDNADPLYSLAPWFTITQSSITVPPKSTKEVEYTINVPKDAEPGGRFGAITFNTIAPTLPSGQSGATVKQQLAGLIFLRINGTAHEQLSIASFSTDKTFYEYGPVDFTTRLKNLGNVHEKATGHIDIKNMLGFKVATVKLDDKNVIPGAIRRIQSQLKQKFMFGRYTAVVTVKNGSAQTLTAKTAFTVIPYKLIGLILLILALVGLFFWKARKRFSRALRILAGKE